MGKYKKYRRYIAGLLVLAAIGFVLVNHGRFWGGVLSDTMTQEEQDRAAAMFDLNDYYGYDAALSDLNRIFSGRNETFVDKVLTHQKPYKEKSGPNEIKKDLIVREKSYNDYIHSHPQFLIKTFYHYKFRKLYHCLSCVPSATDGIAVRFDKSGHYFSVAWLEFGFMWSSSVLKMSPAYTKERL